jgi:CDP-glycerol glycerophosphotransferase (TagB/SpsB family)
MSGDFLDESKYATVINSYSVSIKDNYFRGMNNVVCLGDPRMDLYVRETPSRKINRQTPTVTIGTSAYSPIDLNSFVAVEFEFMHDVLSALKIIKEQGATIRIVIKVRANGYREQYQNFVHEYFPGLVDEILDTVPMNKVLEQTDFYISLYSQTLFEASCLGIPCLYYKNDCEILDPPFDGNSELVTVSNVNDLIAAIIDFQSGHERFCSFLERAVMEKYIGPLDGKNLERNLDFIRQILK